MSAYTQSSVIDSKEEVSENNKVIRDAKDESIKKQFAKRLKSIRTKQDKNKTKVAFDNGINLSMISSYEGGTKVPGVTTAKILADYFGVSLDWLCGKEPDKDTLLHSDDPYSVIPLVYSFLSILNAYSPEIIIGDGEETPYVTLEFKCKRVDSLDGNTLKEFFSEYEAIRLLEKHDGDYAEVIYQITLHLIEKYKDAFRQIRQ